MNGCCTDAPRVTRCDARWRRADYLGALRVRCNIGRMTYAVSPGLYALGAPTPATDVFVSANYKLSFDILRRALRGQDAWILVLDTKGINVWCAAGKGTFGTDELVQRIAATGLAAVVKHRTLIVPQLGAPGVAAHEVARRSGFRVVYGPVRAADLPAFLAAGLDATPAMRRVTFPLRDRLAVVPVELTIWLPWVVAGAAGMALLAGVTRQGFAWPRVTSDGLRAASVILAAFLAGQVLVPALLPWLPGRAFAMKGTWIGLLLACGLLAAYVPRNAFEIAAWLLLLPAMVSFSALNYTGTSTYTSLSGVRREMRYALPLQTVAFCAGLVCWIIAGIIR
jgi:hypothetical protein